MGQFECEVMLGSETYVGEAGNKVDAKLAAAELAFQVGVSWHRQAKRELQGILAVSALEL